MKEYVGKSVCKGIAIGKIKVFDAEENTVYLKRIDNPQAEIDRFNAAREQAIRELNELYEKALVQFGEANAELFNVHAMMLEDDDYNDSVVNIINTQSANAEYAVATTGDNFAKMFADMDDEYFKARSADVKDISERVIGVLSGREKGGASFAEPVILLAKDLTPSETVQLDKNNLLSFVTRFGSASSHTAILARTMAIPALVCVDYEDCNGKMGIVDGYTGKFIVEPDEETLEIYRGRKAEDEKNKALIAELKGKENITSDGRKIDLYANIGSPDDMGAVLANDANGIGLFRSEFLYLESSDYPTEEEQFAAYKRVVETMGGKKVVIRTLDIGADKQVSYFNLDKEENPAMGCRAIRICLTRPEVFKTQLRALFRASAFGNLAIMYPMIISVEEVLKIKEISRAVREELEADGIRIGNVEEGIMIETPAAAVMSDELAKHVDFFSIGTNDLTQYTLAIDRQNSALEPFYNPHHPAILRLIKQVIDNAHREGIWVGICGELGADTELTKTFVDMGIDELSVAPGSVLAVRKAVRDI